MGVPKLSRPNRPIFPYHDLVERLLPVDEDHLVPTGLSGEQCVGQDAAHAVAGVREPGEGTGEAHAIRKGYRDGCAGAPIRARLPAHPRWQYSDGNNTVT